MPSDSAPKHLASIIWTVLVVAAVATVLYLSPETREVARDAAAVLFAIFTTPFILETTLFVVLLVTVLTYNQWRLNKDGEEWVYMVTREEDPADAQKSETDTKLPKAITQRLQGVVLKEKPAPLDEAQAVAGVIEGYLELGMPSQALDEMHRIPDLPDTVESAILRSRVLGSNLATEPALSMLRDAAERFPESRPELVVAAQTMFRWLEKHMPSQVKAQTSWRNEAEAIARLTVPPKRK